MPNREFLWEKDAIKQAQRRKTCRDVHLPSK
nr:MAG TPA: NAD(P)H-quinone oxidoreductase subunit 1 [Caudoviricetes sp.]